jgi:hypothetical protein
MGLPIGTTYRSTASIVLRRLSKRRRLKTSKKHWEKADIAAELYKKHGLPNVDQLLHDLNDARKSAAYGDVPPPDLTAEDVASEIETYVEAVATLVGGP